ncbi:ankyrin repeat-containing domain protein [Aspergillus insuetus]
MLIKEGSTMGTHAGIMGTVFQAACQRKDSARGAVLEYLLNAPGFDPTKSSRYWGSNLATACHLTDIEIVKRLVELKVDINEEDILGRRPIHFALYRELELVEYLCANGAEIFDLDLMERNALHFAVASGRLDVVKYTLDVNPDFVHAGDCAIIEELIARGASITIQAQGLDRQWTPFELARYYDLSYEITKLLIPTPEAAQQSEYASAWARILRGLRYLFAVIGVYYACTECEAFAICFKCYRSRRILHPDHEFNPWNEDDHVSDESDQESDYEEETENDSGNGDGDEYEDGGSAVSSDGEVSERDD